MKMRGGTQTTIDDLLAECGTTPDQRDGLCRHGVSVREGNDGGWTFDPTRSLWVHARADCRLPKHQTKQGGGPSMPKIAETPPPSATRVQADPTQYVFKKGPTTETDQRWWELSRLPQPVLFSIDPGDEHCGVALFLTDDEDENGFRCFWSGELTPDDAADLLAWLIIAGKVHTVVYERFRLYADKAEEQKGSEFETSQLIGVIRWMVRKQNEHAIKHAQWRKSYKLTCEIDGGCAPGRLPVPVKLVGQMADIKKPARGILRFKGIKSWALLHRKLVHEGVKMCTRERCHAVDAELHGWYWLLRGHPRDIEERPQVDSRHMQGAV